MEELVLLYCISKRWEKRFWQSDFMRKRKTHAELILMSKFHNIIFKKYTKCRRNQFADIHSLSEGDTFWEGCFPAQHLLWKLCMTTNCGCSAQACSSLTHVCLPLYTIQHSTMVAQFLFLLYLSCTQCHLWSSIRYAQPNRFLFNTELSLLIKK